MEILLVKQSAEKLDYYNGLGVVTFVTKEDWLSTASSSNPIRSMKPHCTIPLSIKWLEMRIKE